MVTVNARQSANNISDVLDERNVQGLAIVALSAAGGVVVAQEVADRLLPMLGQSRNPSGLTGFAASAGVKGAVALAFGILATNLTGIGLVAAAYMAVGALAGAGADLLNAVQRSGLAAESPRSSRSSSSSSQSSGNQARQQRAARGQVSV
jgi:hypothetical protein